MEQLRARVVGSARYQEGETPAEDAAAGTGGRGHVRQLRSELTMVSALPVAELRAQADALAREIRESDTRIQRTNGEVDLLD
ncbi:hypothetical protein FH609_025770 [Streptomyces sp. 3MP-14]|uniref:Uncharacterized protein n=1 Tax=Streptomyces mimosae TaxID=2586635 RepID=A0A5N6A288_9ACTN|nr:MULTISPECIES: hypothetical protein [Streptomyces]KAB8162016.1 hypothetical protein FH607_023420 [Streptomyces mimosae]KAB8173714.1 hypothetical protein FH609_025770 [Streptomyces sp. 3MP-14]